MGRRGADCAPVADGNASLNSIVRGHACRFWVERAFQDAKTSLGMADDQARGWLAWHHHMVLVMLALLFMFMERRVHCKEIELLSCQDIVELLHSYLPKANSSINDVMEQMRKRHRNRKRSIESAQRKKAKEALLCSC